MAAQRLRGLPGAARVPEAPAGPGPAPELGGEAVVAVRPLWPTRHRQLCWLSLAAAVAATVRSIMGATRAAARARTGAAGAAATAVLRAGLETVALSREEDAAAVRTARAAPAELERRVPTLAAEVAAAATSAVVA